LVTIILPNLSWANFVRLAQDEGKDESDHPSTGEDDTERYENRGDDSHPVTDKVNQDADDKDAGTLFMYFLIISIVLFYPTDHFELLFSLILSLKPEEMPDILSKEPHYSIGQMERDSRIYRKRKIQFK